MKFKFRTYSWSDTRVTEIQIVKKDKNFEFYSKDEILLF